MKSISRIPWVGVTLLFVLVALTAVQWLTPLYGDDFVYLRWMDLHGSGLNVKGAIFRHWDWYNGRLANLLAALTLQWLPHWALSLICGAMATAMMWLELKVGSPRSNAGAMVLLGVMVFGMPWWDNFLMIDIEANYVWAAVPALLMLTMLDRKRGGTVVLAFVSLLAGMMHEALSVALLAGFGAYAVANRGMERRWWAAFGSVALGSIVTLSSPSLWRRVGSVAMGNPDGEWWLIVGASCWLAVIMAIALLGPRVRHRADAYVWMLAAAAVASAIVAANGGVVGRSGWFSQLFALAAICRLASRRSLPAWIAPAVALLIMAHYTALLIAQRSLSRDTRDATERYLASADGLVYADYDFTVADSWWLLGKAVTMPRPGQVYKTFNFSQYYGTPQKMLIVMPTALRHASEAPDGWQIVDSLPSDVGEPFQPMRYPTARWIHGGRRYSVTPLPQGGYLIAPWHDDVTINF